MATKIPIKGIIEINGKQVENTFQNISKEARSLERDLKKLVIGSDEYEKKSAELKNVNAYLSEHKTKLNETKKAAQDFNTEIGNGNKLMSSFKGVVGGFVAADFLAEGIRGAVQFGKELIQRIEELRKIKSELKQLDDSLKGAALDKAASSVKGITDTYGKSTEEIKTAVKGLNSLTGDTNKSLDLIKKGFAAGADASGEMLTQLKEYPTMMKDAKVSAEEMIAIMANSEKMGVYDDKGIDTIKEAMLRLREGTKSTKDAMTELGIDVEDTYKKIADGSLSYLDVIKMVSTKIKETGADSRITGTAIADIFGGPGEDSGYRYISMLGEMDMNLDHLTATTDSYTQMKNKELEANEKLNSVWVGLTDTGSTLNSVYVMLKSGTADFLTNLLGIKQAKVSDEYLNQANRLEFLNMRLASSNISHREKLSIYAQLRTEFPNQFKNLDLERMKHEQIAIAIRSASVELRKKYQLQALNEMMDERGSAFAENSKQVLSYEKRLSEGIANAIANVPALKNIKFNSGDIGMQGAQVIKLLESNKDLSGNTLGLRRTMQAYLDGLNSARTRKNSSYSELNKEAAFMQQQIDRLGLHDVDLGGGTGTGSGTGTGTGGSTDRNLTPGKTNPNKTDTYKYNSQFEAANKAEKEAYFKLQEEKLQLLEDSLDKELALQDLAREKEKWQAMDANRKLNEEIEKLKQSTAGKKLTEAEQADLKKTLADKSDTIVHNLKIDEINEEQHQFKIKTIREKWSAKHFEDFVKAEQRRIEEGRRLDEDAINDISTMEEAELALSQMTHLKLTDQELKGVRNLEDAKRALREDADRKMLAASLISLERQKAQLEEALKGLTGEAAEKLKADLDEITTKITQVKGAIKGGTEQDAAKKVAENEAKRGAVDLLGYSVQDWEDMYNNLETTEGKIQGVIMVMQALSNAARMFSEYQKSLNEKELKNYAAIQDKKKQSLLNQLNTGYITQEQYNQQLLLLEKELANKQAEIAYKQAKAEKTANIMSAIAGTASAVVGALGNKPWTPLNFVLAGLVGALGAAQIGMIMAQPLPDRPSFARGGFTGSGFGDPDNTGFRPAGIVHQNEWVAPEWMTENPRTAKVIDYLESIRLGKTTPMAEGGFVQNTAQSSGSDLPVASGSSANAELMPVLYRLGNFLEYLIRKGVHIEKNAKNGKLLDEMLEEWDDLKNKNKH